MAYTCFFVCCYGVKLAFELIQPFLGYLKFVLKPQVSIFGRRQSLHRPFQRVRGQALHTFRHLSYKKIQKEKNELPRPNR